MLAGSSRSQLALMAAWLGTQSSCWSISLRSSEPRSSIVNRAACDCSSSTMWRRSTGTSCPISSPWVCCQRASACWLTSVAL